MPWSFSTSSPYHSFSPVRYPLRFASRTFGGDLRVDLWPASVSLRMSPFAQRLGARRAQVRTRESSRGMGEVSKEAGGRRPPTSLGSSPSPPQTAVLNAASGRRGGRGPSRPGGPPGLAARTG